MMDLTELSNFNALGAEMALRLQELEELVEFFNSSASLFNRTGNRAAKDCMSRTVLNINRVMDVGVEPEYLR